jgi:hypothetical protein
VLDRPIWIRAGPRRETVVASQMSRLLLISLSGAAVMLASCDALMRAQVSVTTQGGQPVQGARVSLTLERNGRQLHQAETSDHGIVDISNVYGFRSGRRLLGVAKDGYKPVSVAITPRARYGCRIVLSAADSPQPSTGACVPERAVQQ